MSRYNEKVLAAQQGRNPWNFNGNDELSDVTFKGLYAFNVILKSTKGKRGAGLLVRGIKDSGETNTGTQTSSIGAASDFREPVWIVASVSSSKLTLGVVSCCGSPSASKFDVRRLEMVF